jgi:hypothetical protein
VHDLENKKKKAIEYLKQNSGVKFYMKVNVYDDENVQKGKLMLTNIAEDLNKYAKIKVAPMQKVLKEDLPAEEEKPAKTGKKTDRMDEVKKMADKSRKAKETLFTVDDSDAEDDDPESRSNNIYMELGSTVAFKEIDIDEML